MNQNSGFFNAIPMVTRNLLIINLLVFMADTLLSSDGTLTKYLALHFVYSEDFMPHQIITYMFMHGSMGHIFFNMFALFMFGRTLEMVWGPKRFLTYYILTGVGAAALQLIISYIRYTSLAAEIPAEMMAEVLSKIQTEGVGILHSGKNYADNVWGSLNLIVNVPMVGASGGVYGILIAFGMMFPNAELFIIPFPFPIKAKFAVGALAVMAIVMGFVNGEGDNVAHFAHLGGLLTGFIMLMYWKQKGKLNGNYF